MAVFELVIALLFGGALLSAGARRVKVPYPALLALAGVALALLPNAPRLALDPELALTLFVAPVLLDAAFDASPRDLGKNWRPVVGLALVAVGLTVVAVAVVVRQFEPELSWSAAIVLGAIVAPPDAAAATAVLKQLRLPHRLLVILEGESLFNDASALLIYRLGVSAAIAGSFSGWSALPVLALSSVGSVLLGIALAHALMFGLRRVEDVSTAVIMQFVSTFAIWMLAEHLALSGIITVVAFAITAARHAPDQTPARLRVPTYAVWEVAVFVLNVLAFILIGLQLKPILERLSASELASHALTAAAVSAAVIVVRFVWVGLYEGVARLTKGGTRSWAAALVMAWCGMRGIVTLAAALALPDGLEGRPAFPHRDLILFTAFSVVLVTLVVQGLTLGPLLRRLPLDDDGAVENEVRLAREATARAGLGVLHGQAEGSDEALALRRHHEARLQRAADSAAENAGDDRASRLSQLQRRTLAAERRALSDLRKRGVIGDDAYHRVEEELDWEELNAQTLVR